MKGKNNNGVKMVFKNSRFCNRKRLFNNFGFLYLLTVALFFPLSTYAYLDPGTGSYVIQIIIGTVLGAGYVIGVYWRRIISFFQRNKNGAVEEKSPKGKKKKEAKK